MRSLSIQATSRATGICYSVLYNAYKNGTIRGSKTGDARNSSVVLNASDVARFLEALPKKSRKFKNYTIDGDKVTLSNGVTGELEKFNKALFCRVGNVRYGLKK